MKNVEALGLLKMDFLGLRNLDVIDKAVELIGGGLDIGAIPLDDRKTYEMLARADSTGVFQFESSGMRDALRQVKPTAVRGPDRARRALPARADAVHPELRGAQERRARRSPTSTSGSEPITGDSYGICIYQEQYMQIAKQLAGFDAGRGRDAAPRDRQEDPRADGVAEGRSSSTAAPRTASRPAVADQLWKDMESSQDYSFNKAHSACYALIAYRTAWLKANHPCEYMAALISTRDEHEGPRAALRQRVRRDGDRGAAARRQLVGRRLRRRRGQDPLRPQRGEERRRGRPRSAIVAAREDGGPFASIWDFTERVDPQVVNKRSLESLVKCGALDSTGASRMGMLAVLEQALAYGQKLAQDRLMGQSLDLRPRRFDAVESAVRASTTRRSPPASSRSRSCCGSRRRRSGSTSPSTRSPPCATSYAARPTRRSASSSAAATARSSRSAGSSRTVKHLTTKRGEPMVFLQLDDPTGSAEVVVFNSTYQAARELCVTDRILVVKGRVDHKQQGETKLIALEVTAFEAVAERREVRFRARRARGAGRRDPRARPAREGVPGRVARLPGARHVRGAEDLRARARVPGPARLGLPRRGAVVRCRARRSSSRNADVEAGEASRGRGRRSAAYSRICRASSTVQPCSRSETARWRSTSGDAARSAADSASYPARSRVKSRHCSTRSSSKCVSVM